MFTARKVAGIKAKLGILDNGEVRGESCCGGRYLSIFLSLYESDVATPAVLRLIRPTRQSHGVNRTVRDGTWKEKYHFSNQTFHLPYLESQIQRENYYFSILSTWPVLQPQQPNKY